MTEMNVKPIAGKRSWELGTLSGADGKAVERVEGANRQLQGYGRAD